VKPSGTKRAEGLAGRAIIALIRLYQATISSWKRPSCRYIPTCSEYAVDAVRKYGVARGLSRATLRVLRCNPLFPGGYDPA